MLLNFRVLLMNTIHNSLNLTHNNQEVMLLVHSLHVSSPINADKEGI